MDDDNNQLISADGDSDGSGEEKVIDPDLLDAMDDEAELEDDLEEDEFLGDDDEDEEDEPYNLDGDDQ